ncbi:MAG: hypothetical protein GWO07_07115 [Candidatus Dadabacteria bacterium]|nr:hypothetical protein [Candidatus Dadabacteria bacterium]NIS08520.1 hypothetical protein [Candidatus Dadabacteria bacterium]NIY22410.1 hypothetical protein [Candidatus Dadabacteria bacterium]
MGSSKTSNAVRYMVTDTSNLPIYTNIQLKKKRKGITFKHPRTIIKKTKALNNKGKEIEKYEFNSEEWLKLKKPCNIIIDEFHFVADSRNSQSNMNKVTTEFLSMARRIIGFDKYGYGDFILIAQDLGTVDVRVRNLVTTIVYFILHWTAICDNCYLTLRWSSEKRNLKYCQRCGERTVRRDFFYSETFYFKSIELFKEWYFSDFKHKTYDLRYYVTDIKDYFTMYDSLQYIKYS